MKYWLGVVSKEHVLRGVEGGFCQVCHGKAVPLKRMKKGDYLIYYSPKISMDSDIKCQEITAIGKMKDERIYQFQMSENFIPYRRNVKFLKLKGKCSINELREHPEWSKYSKQLRYGHFQVSEEFFEFICSFFIQDSAIEVG